MIAVSVIVEKPSKQMKMIEKIALSHEEQRQLMALWNAEYPGQIGYGSLEELQKYLTDIDPDKHLLLFEANSMIGWLMLFEREGSKWFAMIVNTAFQGKGYGTLLLNRAKEEARELNGWVVDREIYQRKDGSTYRTPLPFYLKNGFEPQPESRFEDERLSAVRIRWRILNNDLRPEK